MFLRRFVPTVLISQVHMFPVSHVPKAQSYQGPLFSSSTNVVSQVSLYIPGVFLFCFPRVLSSQVHMFLESYVSMVLYYQDSVLPRPFIPRVLCSPDPCICSAMVLGCS